jgi:uncharacterized membrane protein
MDETFESLVQATLLFAAIFVMTAMAVTVARKYRDREAQDIEQSSELISKFRELHAEGGLSDEEFRTIKAKLAVELKTELTSDTAPELNDTSSTG